MVKVAELLAKRRAEATLPSPPCTTQPSSSSTSSYRYFTPSIITGLLNSSKTVRACSVCSKAAIYAGRYCSFGAKNVAKGALVAGKVTWASVVSLCLLGVPFFRLLAIDAAVQQSR